MDVTTLKAQVKKNIYMPIRRKFIELKRRKDFEKYLKSTDVFIVGHPKSGNTWLSRMITSLLEDRFEYSVNLSNIRKAIPAIHARDNDIQNYKNFPDPRVFRNEGPVYPDLYPKTIYILRDPRAAYLSYYHHCVHDTQNHEWSIEDFVDEMLTYGCIKKLEPYLIRWDRQVDNWMQRSAKQSVFYVKYEDMHKDKLGVLTQVASYIGIEVDQKMIDRAMENSTFQSMRKEEVTFGAEPYSGHRGEKGYFTRKGKIDSWKKELPPVVVEKIEAAFERTMHEHGYL